MCVLQPNGFVRDPLVSPFVYLWCQSLQGCYIRAPQECRPDGVPRSAPELRLADHGEDEPFFVADKHHLRTCRR